GDIDNDGDIDVVIANIHSPARLLINTIGNRKHWVGLRLLGVNGRDMVGARLEVIRKDAPTLWRRARSDGSYGSANDPRVLVGLGSSIERPNLVVQWPGGHVEEWNSAAIDQYITLKEGSGKTGSWPGKR